MSGSRPRTARYAAVLGTMLVAVIAGATAVFWQIGQGEAARGDGASPDGGSPVDGDGASRDGVLATTGTATVPAGSPVVAADAGAPPANAASADSTAPGGIVAVGGAERPAAPWRPTAEQAYRDSLFLALQAGDTARALDLTDRWLRRLPADTAALRVAARLAAGSGRGPLARARYGALLALDGRAATREEAARAFAAAGDVDAAIALYDALLAEREDAGWRVARARLHIARNDLAAAARDFAVAAARTDDPEWWHALGDVERWRGRWGPAQRAYAQALRTAPLHPAALDGLVRAGTAETVDALLTEPAYVVLAPAAPRVRDVGEGVFAHAGVAGDNTGFVSTRAGSGAGWSPDDGRTVLRASADWRQAGTGGVGAPRADGWQGELGVVRWLGRVRADAALGTARFTGTGDLLTWQAGLEGRAGLARWRTEARRTPAFETLRAGLTLGVGGTGVPLGGTAVAGTASVPLVRGADAWVSGEWLALGDGNARRTVQWALRAPVQGPLSIVWASGVMGFAAREATYWTPSLFASQGLGLEAQWGARGPFAVAARVLPGIAWVRESARGALPAAAANGVPQLNAGLDAAWRRPWGEVAGSAAYGQDRDGGYRAAFGTLRVTVRW